MSQLMRREPECLTRSELLRLLMKLILKAKGISNIEGNLQDKQTISGHQNVNQTARYGRKIKVIPVVGGGIKK